MVRNSLEAGKIHYEGYWKGCAQEIKTFLGPEKATSEASAIWAQKSRESIWRYIFLPTESTLSPQSGTMNLATVYDGQMFVGVSAGGGGVFMVN